MPVNSRKRIFGWFAVLLATLFSGFLHSQAPGNSQSPETKAKVEFIEVEPGIKLEVLDWGGTGRPIVLIEGLGSTAHTFESFSADLTRNFHVYAITRRGYGASSAPIPTSNNYSAERLGDDVIAVLDSLHLKSPILVGHSFGGEELSSIGTRRPERVAGLVYLDAGYRYALSGTGLGDFQVDLLTMRGRLTVALDGITPQEKKAAIDALLTEWPDFEKELKIASAALVNASTMTPEAIAKEKAYRETQEGRSEHAMMMGEQRFEGIHCPILAIYASPHALPNTITGDARIATEKRDTDLVQSLAKRFQDLPNAKVVLLPHATHSLYNSNRDEVIREIRAFAATVDSQLNGS
jgi:pimeloyl-ACP methyl ester carboxylesterase